MAPPDSAALKVTAIMSSKTRISRGDSMKFCGELPQGGEKQWYLAMTLTDVDVERLNTRTSEWKKLPPAPWIDAATGIVTLDAPAGVGETVGVGVGVGDGEGVGVGVGLPPPLTLTRPMLFPSRSQNQMLPSGPVVIPRGWLNLAETGISVASPEVETRTILPVAVYQTAPSGPPVMCVWPNVATELNCVIVPLVVMRLTLPPADQSAPSGPAARLTPTAASPPGTGNSVMHFVGWASHPLNFVRSIRAIRPVWSGLALL